MRVSVSVSVCVCVSVCVSVFDPGGLVAADKVAEERKEGVDDEGLCTYKQIFVKNNKISSKHGIAPRTSP